MSRFRNTVWLLVCAGAVAVIWYRSSVFLPPSEEAIGKTKVIFVTGGAGPYWQATVDGARAASDEHDAELRVEMPEQEEGLAQQMQILIGLEESEVDGIAVSPLHAERQTRLINLLSKKYDVVTFDADAPLSMRKYYVGTSNYAAGKLCAELVKEAVPDGGEVAVLIANLTKDNTRERQLGFAEAIVESRRVDSDDSASPGYEVLDYLIDEGDPQRCRENIRQVLKEHGDLKCLVGANGYHGPIILEVLEEAGRVGECKLVVFDQASETLDGIAAGHIYATVAQDPYKYGYEAVRMLTQLRRGKTDELPIVGGGAIAIRCEAVRQDNLEEFRSRIRARAGQAIGSKAN